MEPVIQDVSNNSLDLSDITRKNISIDTLQLKYAKITISNTKIPIKNRQISVPIQPLDKKSLGSKVKRSHIPRIASPPVTLANLSNSSSGNKSTFSSFGSFTHTKSPHSTAKNYKARKTPTPPPTMEKLSNKILSLSLDSSIIIRSPSKKVTSPKKTPSITNTAKNINDNRTIAQRVSLSKSMFSSNLKTRINTKSYKPDLRTFNEKTPVLTRSPTYKKPMRSIPKESPTKRSISNNNQKKSTSFTSETTPLVVRLTRSTTSSNLKSVVKPMQSKAPSQNLSSSKSIPPFIIPKSTSTRKTTSDFSKSTGSSQVKQESAVSTLQTKLDERNIFKETNPKLNIPKKKAMPKSCTINGGMKDLTTSITTFPLREAHRIPSAIKRNTSISYTKRSVSTIVCPKQERGLSKKVSTIEELLPNLTQLAKTKESLCEWDKLPNIEPMMERAPEEVINSESLNVYEKAEIIKNDKVYYLGKVACTPKSNDYNSNFGFDDRDKSLIINIEDHIKYRYQVLQRLGKGTFGDVLKCYDHKTRTVSGVKIMKNDIDWSLQSMNEIKILKKLHHENILKYIEHFNFRSHICVTTELLAVNLLEALEATNYNGFHISVIRKWSIQLLSGLDYIHSKGIIHADLKPENIMLKSPHSLDLKIIDFGSSCLVNECMYSYIQSRFYRAPEILLGCRYNTKIDIWSFSALIYELYKGVPLFPAKNESHLFKLIVKLIDIPNPRSILSLRNEVFYKGSVNKNNDVNHIDKRNMIFSHFDRLGFYKNISSKPLEQPNKSQSFHKRLEIENIKFSSFIKSALVWNYRDRPDAKTMLNHPFLS